MCEIQYFYKNTPGTWTRHPVGVIFALNDAEGPQNINLRTIRTSYINVHAVDTEQ